MSPTMERTDPSLSIASNSCAQSTAAGPACPTRSFCRQPWRLASVAGQCTGPLCRRKAVMLELMEPTDCLRRRTTFKRVVREWFSSKVRRPSIRLGHAHARPPTAALFVELGLQLCQLGGVRFGCRTRHCLHVRLSVLGGSLRSSSRGSSLCLCLCCHCLQPAQWIRVHRLAHHLAGMRWQSQVRAKSCLAKS